MKLLMDIPMPKFTITLHRLSEKYDSVEVRRPTFSRQLPDPIERLFDPCSEDQFAIAWTPCQLLDCSS